MPFQAGLLAQAPPPASVQKGPKSKAVSAWEASGNDGSNWKEIPKGKPPSSAPSDYLHPTYVAGGLADLNSGKPLSPLFGHAGLAARRFGEAYNGRSIAENREFFSYIVTATDAEGKVGFGTTSVLRGPAIYRTETSKGSGNWIVHSIMNGLPNPPTNAVGTVHTHGKKLHGTTHNGPSPIDRAEFARLFSANPNINRHYIITGDKANVLSHRPRDAMFEVRVLRGRKSVRGLWWQTSPQDPNAPTKEDVYFREAPRRHLPISSAVP